MEGKGGAAEEGELSLGLTNVTTTAALYTPRHHSDSGHSLDLTEIPLRVHVNNLEDSTEEDGSELKCSISRESPSCLTGPSMLTSQAENRSDLKVVQLQLLDNNNIMENPEVFDETELKMPVESSLSAPDVRLKLVQEGGEKAVLVQWLRHCRHYW